MVKGSKLKEKTVAECVTNAKKEVMTKLHESTKQITTKMTKEANELSEGVVKVSNYTKTTHQEKLDKLQAQTESIHSKRKVIGELSEQLEKTKKKQSTMFKEDSVAKKFEKAQNELKSEMAKLLAESKK